jgi:KDO2-lipid IV(A) lauroyltransferase
LTTAWRVGERLGGTLRVLLRERRRVAEENLKRAFPELEPDERCRLLRDHFRELGMSIVELLRFPTAWREVLQGVTVDGMEYLERARATGKGIIVFTAHTGNWEVLAPLWPLLHPNPTVIAFPLSNPSLDRMVARCRQVNGLALVPRTGGLRRLVTELKNGSVVGLLADQDAGPNGVFVPLFGEPVSCEPSPVTLARRLDCPLILCLAFRNADNTHRIVFEAIPPNDDDSARLAFIYRRLEAHIRENPSQWLWIHRRWKTRPVESASLR